VECCLMLNKKSVQEAVQTFAQFETKIQQADTTKSIRLLTGLLIKTYSAGTKCAAPVMSQK
jgi:hypothetical protein